MDVIVRFAELEGFIEMCQFDVVTDRLIHGLMRFVAEWRGDTINGPKK